MESCAANRRETISSDPDQSRTGHGLEILHSIFEETVMEWHPAQLSWDQQMFVLWVLLPPAFVVCGILAFLAPILYREETKDQLRSGQAAGEPASRRG
jgi:hypothetical protein